MPFHLALFGPTETYWLDDPPNLTCGTARTSTWTVGGCLAWPLYLALPGPRMICMRASDCQQPLRIPPRSTPFLYRRYGQPLAVL
jgi:hypothetical protein